MSMENMDKLKEAAEKTQDKSLELPAAGRRVHSLCHQHRLRDHPCFIWGRVNIGGAMIASGMINLVNFVMKNTGSWQYVSKQLTDDRKRREELANCTYLRSEPCRLGARRGGARGRHLSLASSAPCSRGWS
jgi:hypothetical protein